MNQPPIDRPSLPMRSILHADDLGATATVNRNILATWFAGSLQSVSVIANGDAITAAAADVNSEMNRPLRLVVHLNLSEGRPLIDATRIPFLTNSDGKFYLEFMGLWKLWLTLNVEQREKLLQQIEHEFSAQIEKVITTFAPRPVSGLDGHIHIQMLPFLFPLVARLARRYQLSDIRISREAFHFCLKDSLRFGYLANIAKHLLLNYLSRAAQKSATANQLTSPDSIGGVLYSGRMTQKTAAAAICAAQKKGCKWQELIFHPGRAADDEMGRWQNQPSIASFYSSPNRDLERQELVRMANTGKSSPHTQDP